MFVPCLLLLGTIGAAPPIVVRDFDCRTPLPRAGREVIFSAAIENDSGGAVDLRARLVLPPLLRLAADPPEGDAFRLGDGEQTERRWRVQADAAGPAEPRLEVANAAGDVVAAVPMHLDFLPPLPITHPDYIPEPRPVHAPFLVGAHDCPLWEADKFDMWTQILKHRERTPALGFYGQENPEVADWETKWAVEHGIDFFIYCWYRDGQGKLVKQHFGSALHDSLFKSRFKSLMKFTIMWENQSRGTAGVSDEHDLLDTLLPFWIDNYFKRPEYVKVDNKPVLFIYRPEFLVQDLGSEANVARAFDKMRAACRAAGFDGLWLLGEYRGLDANQLQLLKRLGLDCSFAYCWYVGGSPQPQAAIDTQMGYLDKTRQLNILPQVATLSEGWSGWHDEGSIWRLPPADWERLLRRGRAFVESTPKDQLGSRMLLLDNWNEWGEGHYLAPHRQYGFGYLDATRRALTDHEPDASLNLLPEDIGRGPYDAAFRAHRAALEAEGALLHRRVLKSGVPADGLVAWWAFDESPDTPVAFDWSGHRHGGRLRGAKRAPGHDGGGLLCDGGAVVVDSDDAFNVKAGVSIACWVKTDQAGQGNTWMVNRVYAGGTDTGYRLGVLAGAPCFEVPFTSFSHHLSADVLLPAGKWTHLCGTFDGQVIRIYVDGVEHGQMARPGPVHASDLPITLGSYEAGHAAYFRGVLDEVLLYGRALTPAEVQGLAAGQALAKP